MPTYSYECEQCGHKLECVQKMSDEPLRHCPSCKEERLVRVISSGTFLLRGGGWYKDGYSSLNTESSNTKPKKENK